MCTGANGVASSTRSRQYRDDQARHRSGAKLASLIVGSARIQWKIGPNVDLNQHRLPFWQVDCHFGRWGHPPRWITTVIDRFFAGSYRGYISYDSRADYKARR